MHPSWYGTLCLGPGATARWYGTLCLGTGAAVGMVHCVLVQVLLRDIGCICAS